MTPKKTAGKPKSARSTATSKAAGKTPKVEVRVPPLDVLVLKILSLRVQEENPPFYAIKVVFYDQLLVSAVVKPCGITDRGDEQVLATGKMSYDPSDLEKMCTYADVPLVVHIRPLRNVMPDMDMQSLPMSTPVVSPASETQRQAKGTKEKQTQSMVTSTQTALAYMKDTSCCNVDILPLFLDTDKMCIRKRMEPMIPTSPMRSKSWDNLPLLTLSIAMFRNEENARYHKLLEEANWMKVTVVGAYNLLVPYELECFYTTASKTTVYNENQTQTVSYSQGTRMPHRFNSASFYPKWESLRSLDSIFARSDEKINYALEDIQNPEEINLEYYLQEDLNAYTAVWGSFHRSLLLGTQQRWLWKHLRRWKWPVEVHFYGDAIGGHSFMGFVDMFKMLYPGVNKLLFAVPLHWYNPRLMMEKCNCTVLMLPNDKTSTNAHTTPRHANMLVTNKFHQHATTSVDLSGADSSPTGTSTETGFLHNTGADDDSAFVIVEVQLGRPLVMEQIPPYISSSEMMEMLTGMESGCDKRECTGRGQRQRDWQKTLQLASETLRRVPQHGQKEGLTELCNFNRQLSETRARVELMTSFWTEASIFVNNNFNVHQYLESEAQYQELLKMSHVALMKIACDTLIGEDSFYNFNPTLRAARHARQLHDMPHALELYLQVAVKKPFEGDNWRELSTCLKEIDRDWANVCLSKALALDIRHPLTLVSKGCMVYEENPDDAEPFFVALICMYPFWATGYSIASAYFHARELYCISDEIILSSRRLQLEGLVQELSLPRAWERELGDFWESTIILPGLTPYYDAADLLLRIRGIRLAEVCLGIALSERGETAIYFHLVALCYRLQGNMEQALCLVRKAMDKFGQNTYLRCLEGECLHQMGDIPGALAAFEKASGGLSAYSILLSLPCWEPSRIRTILVDLLRRQPSAYGWIALANDWLQKVELKEGEMAQVSEDAPEAAPLTCAAACAVQALKWDRRAGRAWAILAKIVKPNSRRVHCANMAIDCGFPWVDEDLQEMRSRSQESVCHRLATPLKDCRCVMCESLKI